MLLRISDSPFDASGLPEGASIYLERVQRLAPQLASAGERIEQERRIPEPLQRAMVEAGLFRLMIPRSLGGDELHPLTFMRVLEAIAGLEASPAWNVCQNTVCGISAAYLAPGVAKRVFGPADAILAWGPPDPGTRAVAVEGGFQVSGSWSFASGSRHATWLGALCPLYEQDGTTRRLKDGKGEMRLMLVPAGEAAMRDIWQVVGLKGTASDAFSLEDKFVAEDYSYNRDDLGEVREPGWLYQFKATNLYACGFASIALGVARAMLDEFILLAEGKTPRGFGGILRENAATQSDLAIAEARLRAARSFLLQSVAGICEDVQRAGALSLDNRMNIRLAATHAIREAVAVGDHAYETAGATAIFTTNPFERRFRDLHTIVQQVQGRKSHYQTVGKYLLGLDTEPMFM